MTYRPVGPTSPWVTAKTGFRKDPGSMVAFDFNPLHHWKRLYFDPSAEMMTHMVGAVEQSIATQKVHYRESPRRTEEWDLGDELPRCVKFYGPFNSEAWDLDELANLHLPSLQRGSLLLTVCATVEDEFFSLCRLLARSHPETPDINGLPGNASKSLHKARGIERTLRYMQEIIGVPEVAGSREWTSAKPVMTLRNLLAHQNGRAPSDTQMKTFGPHVSSITIGRGLVEDKLVLDESYLPWAISTFDALAHQIQQAVLARFA